MILAVVNWAAIGTIISAFVVLLAAALGLGKWMIDHEVEDVTERQKTIAGEFRPNGGTSFRDHFDSQVEGLQRAIGRSARQQQKIEDRLDRIEDELGYRRRWRRMR